MSQITRRCPSIDIGLGVAVGLLNPEWASLYPIHLAKHLAKSAQAERPANQLIGISICASTLTWLFNEWI
jgi:hypothetical protein